MFLFSFFLMGGLFLCHLQLRKTDSLRSLSSVNTEICFLPIAKLLCDDLIIKDRLSRERHIHVLSFEWHWALYKEKERGKSISVY